MADSEKYFTKTVDGQLSVATVAQSGEIIPEESRPGDKYTTALVQTDDGPQLCVKTFDLNGGGGGGGTVDQTYDPTSTNAQSGTAVAEALSPVIENQSSAVMALDITPKKLARKSTGVNSTRVGYGATPNDTTGSTFVGSSALGNNYCVCVGYYTYTANKATAIGAQARAAGTHSIAIGGGDSQTISARTDGNAENAIQLGQGMNATANSFQVYSYQMLDGNTGKIPMARLPIVQLTQADYDALVSGGTVDANTIYCIIPA